MDSINRKDSYFPGTFFKRSDRILVESAGVYIRIGKGQTIGPFATFREAEIELQGFLSKVNFDAITATIKNTQTSFYQRL